MTDTLHFAQETARRAGQLLREFYTKDFAVGHKSIDIDLVTEADLASERLIVDAIQAQFPGHAILSEEGLGGQQENVDEVPHLWLVDPLDGTVNYAHRYPTWGVTLALAEQGRVVMGVSYDPLRDEMFWVEQGRGAWCNGERISASTVSRLRDALLATGFAYKRATIRANNLVEFGIIMPRVQGIRRAGAALLDMAYVAAGRLDAYWEMYLNPWDWAAGCLLVEEAGGRVTGMDGTSWSLTTENVIASNGLLHDELLALLKEARALA